MAAAVVEEKIPEVLSQTPESSRSSLSASADSLPASSSSSISTSKRSSILRTSTSFTLPSRSNVTFAPLPSVEPRRRKSSVQLGVAARSRMLHHRRMLREHGIPPHVMNTLSEASSQVPVWDHDMRDADDDGDVDDLGPDPAEQAFAAIGRFVKGASRTLWRRMSHKEANRIPRSSSEHGSAFPEEKDNSTRAPDHILGDDTGKSKENNEEGGVWEEEIGGDTWKQLRARVVSDGTVSSDSAGNDPAPVRTSSIEALAAKRTSVSSAIPP